MKKSRFTEAQIAFALRQAESGTPVAEIIRKLGIAEQTFYRWKNRFDPYDLTTLEEESRRPRHVRQPQTPAAVVERILELRTRYPRWGKKKLVVLLARERIKVSASTAGRVRMMR